MQLSDPLVVIGAASLVGALIAYLRYTAKAVFPIVLALVGVFLCGAPEVKANIPVGCSVEFTRQVVATTQQVIATNDASTAALAKQDAVLQQLGTRLDTLQAGLRTLQTAVNTRLAQADAAPVAVPELQTLDASRADLGLVLRSSQLAHQRVTIANNQLRSAVESLTAKQ